VTADNLPKGKVPKLERWEAIRKYESRRSDGIFSFAFLMENTKKGANRNGKIYVVTYKRK